MKQKLIFGMIAASLLSVSFPATSFAWGKTGHRVGVDIAQDYLSADTKDAITSILGVEGLPEASTWPDFMRSSPEEFWRGDSRTWHYVTIPKGEVYGDSHAPETGTPLPRLQTSERFGAIP